MTRAHLPITRPRPGETVWYQDASGGILAAEVQEIVGSIARVRRCGADIEIHFARLQRRWKDAADSPRPAGKEFA